MASDTYQIYAVRYAHHDRRAHENFLQGDPHDTAPMPLDYFVWAIVGESRTFILDTGFDTAMAKKRGREFLRPPGEGLTGDRDRPGERQGRHHQPHALRPYRQQRAVPERDLSPAGPRDGVLHRALHVSPTSAPLVRGSGCDGDDRPTVPWPGAIPRRRRRAGARASRVHHVGGHTDGLQIVRVKTERGWVVLASDASHFYANFEQMRAYPTVYNVGDMLEGFAAVPPPRDLVGSTSFPATIHWCCSATPQRSQAWRGSRSDSMSNREGDQSTFTPAALAIATR